MLNKELRTLGLSASPYGVGKSLGKHVWLHKSALVDLDVKNKDLILTVMTHGYCVVRLDNDSDSFQLSLCPGFNDEREPKIHGHKTYTVIGGEVSLLKSTIYQTKNLLIYHHKHLFVTSTYSDFDRQEAIDWSFTWKSALPSSRNISSRIGRINGWVAVLKSYMLSDIS